jgi:hypothetical protein
MRADPGSIRRLDPSDLTIAGVTIVSVEPVNPGLWRYYYSGTLPDGVVSVRFLPGQVSDRHGNGNLEQRTAFTFAAPGETFYLSTRTGGALTSSGATGIAFSDADILRLRVAADDSYDYAIQFDGSDVGLTRPSEDIDAFTVLADSTWLISTAGAFAVPGPNGTVLRGRGEDLLRFQPTALGDETAGTWSMFLDGSDVGLLGAAGNIDAVAGLDDGQLLVSTAGRLTINGLTVDDEDLLAFQPTALGSETAGAWALYLDGSAIGLGESAGEDVDALAIEPARTADGLPVLHFSTRGNFRVPGVTGANDDIVTFRPTGLNATTSGSFDSAPRLDGSRYGLGPFDLDGVLILPQAGAVTTVASAERSATHPLTYTAAPPAGSVISPLLVPRDLASRMTSGPAPDSGMAMLPSLVDALLTESGRPRPKHA